MLQFYSKTVTSGLRKRRHFTESVNSSADSAPESAPCHLLFARSGEVSGGIRVTCSASMSPADSELLLLSVNVPPFDTLPVRKMEDRYAGKGHFFVGSLVSSMDFVATRDLVSFPEQVVNLDG